MHVDESDLAWMVSRFQMRSGSGLKHTGQHFAGGEPSDPRAKRTCADGSKECDGGGEKRKQGSLAQLCPLALLPENGPQLKQLSIGETS